MCDTHRLAAKAAGNRCFGARAPAQRASLPGGAKTPQGSTPPPTAPPATRRGASEGRSIAATSADGGSCVAANASDTPSRVAHAEARSVGVDVRVMYASAKSAASANDHATAPMRRHARISCTSRTYHA